MGGTGGRPPPGPPPPPPGNRGGGGARVFAPGGRLGPPPPNRRLARGGGGDRVAQRRGGWVARRGPAHDQLAGALDRELADALVERIGEVEVAGSVDRDCERAVEARRGADALGERGRARAGDGR